MTTLSLEAAKKLYEILGKQETRYCWFYVLKQKDGEDYWTEVISPTGRDAYYNTDVLSGKEMKCLKGWPTYTFEELVRILPKIGEKKGWKEWVNKSEENGEGLWNVTTDIVSFYQESPTEEQGMEEVSKCLLKIL